MGTNNNYQGIYEYAVKIIRVKAIQLLGKYGFTKSDREDIEQELMLDLLRRLPKFNPKLSQHHIFVNRVVEHKIATDIEARKAGLRDYRRCNCSLNDRLENEEGGTIERMDTITEDDYFQRTGSLSRPAAELHDISMDVERALEKLPNYLRDQCERLMAGDTITEISQDTGIPRSTLYDRLDRLRKIFEDAGLRDYL